MEIDAATPPDTAIGRRRLPIAAGLCWAGWAAMVWLVVTGQTAGFDRWGLLAFRTGADLHPIGSASLVEAVRDMTALGGVLLRNLFAAMAVVALLFLRMRREAVLFAMTVASGWIANTGMKLLVARDRPQIVPHLTEAGGQSFPSGHSFSAALVYIAMALVFANLSGRASVRATVIGAAVVLSAMVAWSRVMLGVHYPSDVVAGWLGGAGWALASAALFYRPAQVPGGSATAKRSRARGS